MYACMRICIYIYINIYMYIYIYMASPQKTYILLVVIVNNSVFIAFSPQRLDKQRNAIIETLDFMCFTDVSYDLQYDLYFIFI